jgi:hypothetical protein
VWAAPVLELIKHVAPGCGTPRRISCFRAKIAKLLGHVADAVKRPGIIPTMRTK